MADSPQLGLQDASSPIMEELLYFHDHALLAVFLISTLVLYVMVSTLSTKLSNTNAVDAQDIEMVWTIMPAAILAAIALPSLRILYLMDEVGVPEITIKAIGHQWNWSYEYSDMNNLNFNSYMLTNRYLFSGDLRLLDVDNRMAAPLGIMIRMLITAEDVLHSWAVPALGVKTDAIPGRLSQISLLISRPGLYYGQCSEICGANHSFMPIVIESLPTEEFLNWSSEYSL